MSPQRHAARHALWIGVLAVPIAWLLSQIVALLLGGILAWNDETTPTAALERFLGTQSGFLVAILLGQAAFALVLLLAVRNGEGPLRARLGLHLDRERWRGALWFWLAFGTLGVKLIGGVLLGPFLSHDTEYGDAISSGLEETSLLFGMLLVVLMSVLPACIEEGLFRGFMLRGMLKGYSPAIALPTVAIVFAFAHPDPDYAVGLLPTSFWLGWVCHRTNSLFASMWCHFVNNFVAAAAMLAIAQAQIDLEQLEAVPFWIQILVLQVVILSVFGFLRSIQILGAFPAPQAPPAESEETE